MLSQLFAGIPLFILLLTLTMSYRYTEGPLAETQMSTQGAIAAHLYTEPQLARPRPLHMQMYLNMGFNSAGTQMYRTPHILGEKLA